MKPVSNDRAPDVWIEPGLFALVTRLQGLARHPAFQTQCARALERALRPYEGLTARIGLLPVREELALADLYVAADYFPDDGQLSLIEQVRDTVDVHVPDAEREWLDPLRHSSMDVLEVTAISEQDSVQALIVRSHGNGRTHVFKVGKWGERVSVGQSVLTRLIEVGGRSAWPGVALLLSHSAAERLVEDARDWQRQMEAESGAFNLGEWAEFTKRYGHVLLWMYAQARMERLLAAEAMIRYRIRTGEPLLYATALYEHHAEAVLRDGLDTMEGLRAEGDGVTWIEHDQDGEPTSRVTLTPVQLFIECNSGASLDRMKHRLAAAFGFSIRFRAEMVSVPRHEFPEVNLETDDRTPAVTEVSEEEQGRLLAAFLEHAYLEWADQPSPALEGHTPRHAATRPEGQDRVARLIDRLEADDLGSRRLGRRAFDYNRLRAHVGIAERAA